MKLKKMLAGFMTLCMMATAVPVTVLADDVIDTADELQAAIDAAEGTTTIELGGNIEGNVTVTQKEGVYLTIDGTDAKYDFKGVLTISGQSSQIKDQSTTIKDIDFVGTESDKACIYVPGANERYSRNVSVIDCNFSGDEIVAIKQATGGCLDWLIEGCTVGKDMHSMMQVANITGLTISGCEINSARGVNLNQSTDVKIADCTFEVEKYAVRCGQSGNVTEFVEEITLTGNTITTKNDDNDAAIILRGSSLNADLTMSDNTVTANAGMHTDGFSKDDLTNNTWNIPGAVAEVNGVQYATLAEAVEAAKSGEEVTLLKDAEGAGIVIDKDITIDFDKHTYNIVGPAVGSAGTTTLGFQILSGNTVTLKDGTITESAPEQNDVGETDEAVKMLVQNYSNLKLEDMVLDGSGLGGEGRYTLSNNCGTVELTGKTKIIADYNKGIALDACEYASYAVPTVTIGKDCVVDGKLEVTGNANLVIKGGTFTDLANAVKYAENGAEIALLEDVEGSGIVIDKDITIDFGDYTYALTEPVGSTGTETNGFQILKDNDVTLKNGTLEVAADDADKFYILVQNYSNLKVENMTLDGTNLDKYSGTDGDSYTLSNNHGEVVITGNTTIIANDEGNKAFAFDVCKFGSYDAPTVTFDADFKGGAKGAFEVSEGLEDNLKIHAGYFTQDPTAYVVKGKEVKVIDKDGYTYMVGDPDPTPSTSSSKKSSKKYSVDIEDAEDGTVKASSTRVKKGATVTLTVTPDDGYELDEIIVLDDDGEEVKLKDKGNGKYTFTMPRGGVEVEASFVEEEDEKEPVTTEKEFIKLTIGQKIVWIFDEYVVNDVAPEIKNDRTMLPIRVIAEALGAKVTWNEVEQKVTIAEDDLTIEIFIGQPFATVNGKPVQLDAPAYIANGRTYLPLRFVAENLGATVEWNAADSSVTIFE